MSWDVIDLGKTEISLSDMDFFKAIEEKKQMLSTGGEVQKFVDSEVLKLMVPYTPMDTGNLIKSAIASTVIGSGKIQYNAPYAKYLYYGVVYGPNIPIFENGTLIGFRSPPKKESTGRPLQYSTEKHPLAGKLWFERMKADYKEDILKGAKAIAVKGKQR